MISNLSTNGAKASETSEQKDKIKNLIKIIITASNHQEKQGNGSAQSKAKITYLIE
jgi:hypothetical protein